MANPDIDAETTTPLTLLQDPRVAVTIGIALVGTFATNIASPALPAIASTFSVSEARIGLVMTAFTVPTIVAVPITGVLADTYGRRPIVFPSLVTFGLAGIAVGLAPSFNAILLLRAVQGAAFAGVMPLTVTILGDLHSGAAGSTAQGLRVSINGISTMATPAVTGFLVAIAWSHPFALFGLAFPVAAVAWVVLPETGGSGTADDTGQTSTLQTLREYTRSIWTQIDDRDSRTLLFGGFARDFVRLTVITFVPLFAVSTLGATPLEAGLAVSMRGVPRVIVSPLAGAVVGRFSQTHALAGAFGIAAVGALSIALSPTVPVLWGSVVLYGAGDSLLSPVLKNAIANMAAEEYRAGVINGLQVLKSAAQSIAPALFGVVLVLFGFAAVFVTISIIGLCYAVATLLWVS